MARFNNQMPQGSKQHSTNIIGGKERGAASADGARSVSEKAVPVAVTCCASPEQHEDRNLCLKHHRYLSG